MMYPKSFILLMAMLPCYIRAAMTNENLYFPDEQGFADTLNYPQEIKATATDNLGFGSSSPHDSQRVHPLAPQTNLVHNAIEKMHEQLEKVVSKSVTKLTLAINRELIPEKSEQKNVVFAPVSIAAALALVLLGANGKTFEEITTLMGDATGIDIQKKSNLVHHELGRTIQNLKQTSGITFDQEVNFAAGIFVQDDYPIRTLYREAAADIYESEVLNVDFQSNPSKAQQIINAWVAERTKGKISSILGEVPSTATKVIIASAMYFKALWEKPFFEGSTTRRSFYPNGRREPSDVMVEMMANGGEFPYYKDMNLHCEIVGLPYKGNSTVMYIVMPFDSSIEKLKEFEKSLTEQNLVQLADKTTHRGVLMLMPKMKIESTIDLNKPLQSLGVKSLFRQNEANLALLSPGVGAVAPSSSSKLSSVEKVPLAAVTPQDNQILIFSRTGEIVNCSGIFDKNSDIKNCSENVDLGNGTSKVIYKKIGDKVGRRIVRSHKDDLDVLRQKINEQSMDNNYQNPGLYADQVIHKVYIDITETGTEAAASTSVSLSRDGSRVTMRIDVPFLFFIRHEDTKTILFWGSVNLPTPYFKT